MPPARTAASSMSTTPSTAYVVRAMSKRARAATAPPMRRVTRAMIKLRFLPSQSPSRVEGGNGFGGAISCVHGHDSLLREDGRRMGSRRWPQHQVLDDAGDLGRRHLLAQVAVGLARGRDPLV